MYPCNGVYGINDDAVSSSAGWSSKKVMDKLAHVKSIIRVDEKPTFSDGTITYVKDGTSYTTTDTETWFYYIIDDLLYKTTFIDGVEYTKDDSSVDFDGFVAKTDIVTTLDSTATNKQVVGAKTVYEMTKDNNIKTFATLDQLGLSSGCDVTEIVNTMPDHSYAEIGCYNATNSYGLEFVTGLPNGEANFILTIRKYNLHRVDIQAKSSASGAVLNDMYIGGMVANGTTVEWEKVCTTSVPDVSKTTINLDGDCAEVYQKISTIVDNTWFSVKNGWCMVQIDLQCLKEGQGHKILTTSLPKPISSIAKEIGGTEAIRIDEEMPLQVIIATDGVMSAAGGRISSRYIGFFSYPVAEDWRP